MSSRNHGNQPSQFAGGRQIPNYAGFKPGRTQAGLPQLHSGENNVNNGRRGVVDGPTHGNCMTIEDMHPALKSPRYPRVTTEVLDPTKAAIRMNLPRTANPFDRNTNQKPTPEQIARKKEIIAGVWKPSAKAKFETREAKKAFRTRRPLMRTEQQLWTTRREQASLLATQLKNNQLNGSRANSGSPVKAQ